MPDKNSLMFRDGEKRIDYVLAYTDLKDERDVQKREAFHKQLQDDGLLLEFEDKRVRLSHYV